MEIRRRPPNPKVKVAHLEYAIPHEDAEPRNILEKIVWEKDREVASARDRVGLEQLKKQVAELPVTRDFLAALKAASTRGGGVVARSRRTTGVPGAALAARGVDLILNPSASHFAFGKYETRQRFVVDGSRSCSVTYLYANLMGNESGRAIYDGGALIACVAASVDAS